MNFNPGSGDLVEADNDNVDLFVNMLMSGERSIIPKRSIQGYCLLISMIH